ALFSFGGAAKHIRLQTFSQSYYEPYAADPGFSSLLLASSKELAEHPFLQKLGTLEDWENPEIQKNGRHSVLTFSEDSGITGAILLDAHSPAYRAWSGCESENNRGYYPQERERPPGKQQSRLLKEALHSPAPVPTATAKRVKKLRLVVPVFPGSNSEDDMLRSFARAAHQLGIELEAYSPVINLLDETSLQNSLRELARLLNEAQIFALPGGFSASDEPDGSAKFIASVLREPRIAEAIDRMLDNDGLILGICNGFQALIKSGLLPYGRDWQAGAAYGREGLSIGHNRQGRHIADLELCRVCPTSSPWLTGMSGKDFLVPVSHGEGRLIMNETVFQRLRAQGQIAAVYHCDVNGSFAGIEALCSQDGRILGKMAHSERRGPLLYCNIPHDPQQVSLDQDIFSNGLKYFYA
ncbi:MAG: phosphoribosylformylglycinamidine synthase subunit PurQ, partial [Spirochaetota bacterium]